MRYLLPLALLAACGIEQDPLLPAEQLPPPVFDLAIPNGAPIGGSLTLVVSGTLGEDERVLFGYGSGVGNGPCPPRLGGNCLGITQPALLGNALVDANGNAALTVPLPNGFSLGDFIGVQAVVARGLRGGGTVMSDPVLLTVSDQASPSPGETTYDFPGGYAWVVPVGITQISVEMCGGAGGDGWNGDIDAPLGFGGGAGFVDGAIAVTPGETLTVRVGSAGGDGTETTPGTGGFNDGGDGAWQFVYSGGGGGGATDIRRGIALTDRLAVAAGGGGGSGWCTNGSGDGGAGGGPVGASGSQCSTYAVGTGGSQTAGGSSGGTLGLGGNATTTGGAGGGAGYYGGGSSDGSGAGGGSNLAPSGGQNTQGTCIGDGYIIISW